MDGFFTRQELERFSHTESNTDKETRCLECGLFKGCNSPKMEYTGEGRLKCLIIGEGPAREEDATGIQFKGDVGQYFRGKLAKEGLELDRDFYKMNAINCWSKDSQGRTRTPTKAEIEFCRPMVNRTIAELKPEYIWLLGGCAIQSFHGNDFKGLEPTRWRGLCIPDQKTGAWVLPMFHPSYPRRGKHIDQNIVSLYDRDLKNAVDQFRIDKERISFDNCDVISLYEFKAVISLLDKILQETPPFLFIDFETTGIKPYEPGHKIVSMSLCFSPEIAYSFPMKYRSHWTTEEYAQIKKRVRQILKHPKIKKQSHNIKFEIVWAREILGVEIAPCNWCSMNAAHVLDNRRAFTTLDFQVHINFGILPYSKNMNIFIKGKSGIFNRIEEAPLDELLDYGGHDSLYGFALTRKQKRKFKERLEKDPKDKLLSAYWFFLEGLQELSRMEATGVPVDEVICKENEEELTDDISALKKSIMNSEEVKKFKEETKREINLASTKDLGFLVYDILKAKDNKTSKGNLKTGEDALKTAGLRFTEDLLRLRTLEKVLSTYLSPYKRFAVDGKIHPTIDLHIPVSFRSSSSDPNIQNVPVRDAIAKRYCRTVIVPSEGNQLLESDFKGVEVSTGTCYHKDPTMIIYNTDPNTDMHRDTAMDLWKLPGEEITSDIRFYAKNDWVFAEFYGSWYKMCAQYLWEDCKKLKTKSGVPLREHIRSMGIKSLGEFTEHCKDVERIFWDERFKGYKKWKEDNNILYRKQGYLETFLGFIYSGPMSSNEVCNYQIQGTAFHLLLWTMLKLAEQLRIDKKDSKILTETHDSMLIDLVPSEKEYVINTIDRIGTKEIRKAFPWIIVPLQIDHEVSPLDGGTWFDMGKEFAHRPRRRK